MKAENWIIAAGLAFAVMVLVAALLPEKTLDSSVKMTGEFIDRGTAVVMGAGQEGPVPAPLAQSPQQQQAGRQNTTSMTGMVPFTRAKTTRFDGKVIRLIHLGNNSGWGQLRVWVDDGKGPAREVSVAPDWYLMHLGCTIAKNDRVKGVAFTFGKVTPDSELYAKNITIAGGRTCDLRNDEGFALWSNRLR